MQRRLLATHYAAKTSIEEQGVNVLFLALGMLIWYEADSSRERRQAPLILIPVQLERSSALERFHLRYTEEDVGDNVTLREKLRTDFGLALPPVDEDTNVDAYFDAVVAAVATVPRWSVDRRKIVLAFFSFGKFLMYRDLDGATWPADATPAMHPILQALFRPEGFKQSAYTLGDTDDVNIDRHLAPANAHHVKDADSSQALAIMQAGEGYSMVIEGPPGTGKSQTITNLIADALARGKTVLFVSEKMAALEVVKRRLDEVGLGDACLELHSNKTQKRAVLDELKRTLDLARPRQTSDDGPIWEITETRDRLNAYCEAMNSPIGASSRTPFYALGTMLRIREQCNGVQLPPIDVADIDGWSDAEFGRRLELVRRLQSCVADMGAPRSNAFWGSTRTRFLLTDQERLAANLTTARQATARLREASAHLQHLLGFGARPVRADTELLCRMAATVATAPQPLRVDVLRPEWRSERVAIMQVLQRGAQYAALHRRYDTLLRPEVWTQATAPTRDLLARYSRKWWRALSAKYRAARVGLTTLFEGAPPQGLDEQLAALDAVAEAQRIRAELEEQTPLASALFGPLWLGTGSDWAALTSRAEWVLRLHSEIEKGVFSPALLDVVTRGATAPNLSSTAAEAVALLAAQTTAVRSALEGIGLEHLVSAAAVPFADLEFTHQEALLEDWHRRLDELRQMAQYTGRIAECQEEGLAPIAALAPDWIHAGAALIQLFAYTRYHAMLDRAFRERPVLAEFVRDEHEARLGRFCLLDKQLLAHTSARLAQRHAARLPRHDDGYGQLNVLRHQFELRRRHLPIRKLMEKAGNAIQAIKPVCMMSPLSIAAYLPPGSVAFDIVIFDEASQVKPVDAFGAIVRGQQAVVVGDDRQLPPTSFFDKLTRDEDLDEEEGVSDVESILGLFRDRGASRRMLRWHYRSQHESLIAVSNREFYGNRLVIFPGPDATRTETGLVFHHLKDAVYDSGGNRSRTNQQEAKAVAQAVMAHARTNPELTLGVAAFSMTQRQAIEDHLEHLRRQDRSCEPFFDPRVSEPFFVKNLENVQGDERDVIFISIGYGRTVTGRVSMQFGPLNREGGERRLNVLITRARRRCEVFSNITADDLQPQRSDAKGVKALQVFLDYAQNRALDSPAPADREMDSPFEAAVCERLVALGYEVVPQVGCAGFFIDLAVVDPNRRGRYLLGIECDGATYHSARSARDRDRLRQEVLERLGWRIHRIWSTDWFRNPASEVQRVVEAIDQARASITSGGVLTEHALDESPTSDEPTYPDPTVEVAHAPAVLLPPYTCATLRVPNWGVEMHALPAHILARLVTEVVAIEGPVHTSEVGRRIADSMGVRRIGARIQGALDWACQMACASGQVRRRGDFLWSATMSTPVLRDRSLAQASVRRLEAIAPEEIELAVLRVLSQAYGMVPEQVPLVVSRLLGFQRVSEDMRGRIDEVVEGMIKDRRLARQGDHLVVKAG